MYLGLDIANTETSTYSLKWDFTYYNTVILAVFERQQIAVNWEHVNKFLRMLLSTASCKCSSLPVSIAVR